MLHAMLLATLLAFLTEAAQHGTEETGRTGGIVLVDIESKATTYINEGDLASASTAMQLLSEPPALPSFDHGRLLDDDGHSLPVADLASISQKIVEGQLTSDKLTQSTTNADGRVGGQVTTEVFGVKGTGSLFLYLLDRSASMEGYEARPLRAAKRQVISSLNSLTEAQQFQLVFYNETTKLFAPNIGSASLLFATDANKSRAERYLESIRADGGTDHLLALKAALALGPDVIFMLTDAEGGFTANELNQIANWNRSGAVINAIQFGVGGESISSDRSLETLARQNRGQYLYIDIMTLSDFP